MSLPINLDDVYDALDSMKEMKRYKAPTHDYFPTAAEINTYVKQDAENMIPYLIWLEEELTQKGMETHKEARAVLRKAIAEMTDRGDII